MLKKTVQAAAAMALAFFIANPVLISAAQPLSFEAVSIHPLAPPFRALRTMKISGTLLTLEGYNLPELVEDAFGIKGYRSPRIPSHARRSTFSTGSRRAAAVHRRRRKRKDAPCFRPCSPIVFTWRLTGSCEKCLSTRS
jgi:hypothetical protein